MKQYKQAELLLTKDALQLNFEANIIASSIRGMCRNLIGNKYADRKRIHVIKIINGETLKLARIIQILSNNYLVQNVCNKPRLSIYDEDTYNE
jgi:hypothetical protein